MSTSELATDRGTRALADRGARAVAARRPAAPSPFSRRFSERARDDSGMTLTEVLIAATLLIVLLTLVAVTMGVVTNVSSTVTSQFQEYDQALPALAPLQTLLRAQVEPAAPSGGKPSPPFAQYATMSLNFGVQFYANIGTAYNNLTAAGTTAGPAKIVALELDQSGNPVTSATQCKSSSPCSFQVRRYLPIVFSSGPNTGLSSCPVAVDGTAGPCQYPATYTLITNALHVINNPSATSPYQAIFTYSFFDPNWPNPQSTGTTILISASQVQNNQMTGLSTAPNSYPSATQTLTACAATSAAYPTSAIACPLDAIQSVGIDLMVASPGSGPNGTVENQTVVYRYAPTGTANNLVYPYQFTSAVG